MMSGSSFLYCGFGYVFETPICIFTWYTGKMWKAEDLVRRDEDIMRNDADLFELRALVPALVLGGANHRQISRKGIDTARQRRRAIPIHLLSYSSLLMADRYEGHGGEKTASLIASEGGTWGFLIVYGRLIRRRFSLRNLFFNNLPSLNYIIDPEKMFTLLMPYTRYKSKDIKYMVDTTAVKSTVGCGERTSAFSHIGGLTRVDA